MEQNQRSGKNEGQPAYRGKVYATATDAIAELLGRNGPISAQWTYTDANRIPMGEVLRWNREDGGKDILPVSVHKDGWRLAGMPEPRPLYNLPAVVGAQRVYVTEGEKAADELNSIGLVATTSAHGASSAHKTNWTPLSGKGVVILPDNDVAGRGYADAVASILARLDTAPSWVKIVNLPGLPERGDAFEWINDLHGDAATPDVLREELEKIVDETPAVDLQRMVNLTNDKEQTTNPRTQPSRIDFEPFPLETLPEPCRNFVAVASSAIGCDPSFVALPLLSGLAAAIGNTRVVEVKPSWTEPSVIWTAIVGTSGTLKSPALDAALRPIRLRQAAGIKAHEEAISRYNLELLGYEVDLKAWKHKGRKNDELPPDAPTEPVCERFYCSDVTVEALADRLQHSPRGLLLERDELAGWFGSFDQYRGGRGGDSAHWLMMHGARELVVDRKSGDKRTIFVPRAAVSVTGGIQPEILRQALGQEHLQDGLAARLLLAMPPVKPKRWSECCIDASVENKLADLFDRLWAFDFDALILGDVKPVVLPFTADGKQVWEVFYNEHNAEQAQLTGDLAAAWSKLEGYAARLALVLHCVRVATEDPTLESIHAIDRASVLAAAGLVQWFGNEAKRVYRALREADEVRSEGELIEWIERRGGRTTARNLQNCGPRAYRFSGVADAALDDLFRRGRGRWETVNGDGGRGRPTTEFVLGESGDGDTNSASGEKTAFLSPSPVAPRANSANDGPLDRAA